MGALVPRLRDALALLKPGITGMAVFMAGGALLLSPHRHDPVRTLLALLGIGLLVGAANAFNQVIERRGDALMERTRDRPLPAGRLTTNAAILIATALAAAAFTLLAVATNPLSFGLGALAMVLYIGVYTPLKYRTAAAVLVGAVPGAMPALLGWTASTGRIDPYGFTLFLILFVWQIPHFLAISLFRHREYTRAGIHVVPAVRGEAATRRETLAYTLALVPTSLALVPLGAGAIYAACALLAGGVLVTFAVMGMKDTAAPWPRRYFFATLAYLPALVIGLAVDGALS
jgi:protoheme IX farnesyltransferase